MSLNEKKAGFNWFGSVTAHDASREILSPALGNAIEVCPVAISPEAPVAAALTSEATLAAASRAWFAVFSI
jgi:hypothetical protein